MGKIVGGFLVPHDPVMFVAPEAPAPDVAKRMWAAFATCARRLAELEPTSVVIVGADHYMLFGTSCLPQYVIGTGDVDGPIDALPGLRRGPIQANEALATHIARHGHQNGFDWAVARAFTVDHAVGIPNQLLVDPLREGGRHVGTVPIYLAAGVDPYIPLRRAAQLGGAVRAAVEAAPCDERVAVIGSGGISHWVGLPEMGRVNEAFDREILDYAVRGDLDGLVALSDDYILANGGNGGMEIRQWACAMGAMPGATGEVIDYEPVPEWVTGLGFVQLHA
ncbi:protocatechuate 3,4-dioxygenase [Piscinibacter gummiphilus]|uniref:Protocatechuate 3,4-dioxygenase n=1 Tax=Piscinibacter gummiphilus TaxID=946333 RepID=A0A1W6L5U3_9BURK|nr:protocatechuate 3,4-dioxygenase [Piscinibacter gummiphilus]ARN19624.1 protocatechuate 3,4-dioxygenase [Piscinibacter gummiphilus]ATU64293.1 protocatechuate 3,4-dioxygenase [Piscinibacter gummiphilus]GLS93492.1 2,3-dihydroxyphenylpropionate 1,2-dioxygenase [Piscinibacter gummiphilus]